MINYDISKGAQGAGTILCICAIITAMVLGLRVIILIPPAAVIFLCIWTIGVLVVKTIKNPADPQIFGDSEHPTRIRLGIAALCLTVGGLAFWWFWSVLTKFVIA